MINILKTGVLMLVLALLILITPNKSLLANSTIQAVLYEVNLIRQKGAQCRGKYGGFKKPAKPLKLNNRLNKAAKKWSQFLAQTGQATHGNNAKRIKKACGKVAWGEVIAFGTNMTASQAVQGWLKSTTGHCAHIMNPNYKLAGIGKARGHPKYDTVWTMKLAKNCKK